MTKAHGILLISHVEKMANGLYELLNQVASDVSIKVAAGTENGEIGTSFDKISQALEEFTEEKVLVFYDLGSAKMNVEIAMEFSDKEILLYSSAFVEGAYTAAALLQANMEFPAIEDQLNKLLINK